MFLLNCFGKIHTNESVVEFILINPRTVLDVVEISAETLDEMHVRSFLVL